MIDWFQPWPHEALLSVGAKLLRDVDLGANATPQVNSAGATVAGASTVVAYTAVLAVNNPDHLLKPGMTAQTRIVVSSKPKVTRLPTAALRFRPDEDSLKAKGPEAPASAASAAASGEEKARADDDGVLNATRSGAKVYRVYTVGEKQSPKLHEVTIGISNTRFTELISSDLKPGNEVITRNAESPGKK